MKKEFDITDFDKLIMFMRNNVFDSYDMDEIWGRKGKKKVKYCFERVLINKYVLENLGWLLKIDGYCFDDNPKNNFYEFLKLCRNVKIINILEFVEVGYLDDVQYRRFDEKDRHTLHKLSSNMSMYMPDLIVDYDATIKEIETNISVNIWDNNYEWFRNSYLTKISDGRYCLTLATGFEKKMKDHFYEKIIKCIRQLDFVKKYWDIAFREDIKTSR